MKIGTISQRIVSITNNPQTKQFVGRSIITDGSTNAQSTYRISGTNLFFSKQEIAFFIKKGAVVLVNKSQKKGASPTVTPGTTPVATMETKQVPKRSLSQNKKPQPVARKKKSSPTTTAVKQTKKNSVVSEIKATETNVRPRKKIQAAVIPDPVEQEAPTNPYLEDSSFFDDYNPVFKIESPKHHGFLNFKDKVNGKMTGFFDKIGKKITHKVIDNIESARANENGSPVSL